MRGETVRRVNAAGPLRGARTTLTGPDEMTSPSAMTFKSASSALAAAAVLSISVLARSDGADTIKIPRAGVKLDAPSGWVKQSVGDWTRIKPTDEFARLEFVVFDKPHEATRRIGEIAEHFELSNMSWGSQESTTVGAFPAQAASAKSCTLKNGDACHLWYATVNPGTAEQVLIVHLVNATKGEKHRGAVHACVQSLRKM